jgi:methylisocitrate lyase
MNSSTERSRNPLATLLTADGPVVAPLVLNPLMAKLAAGAGFTAGYVGGGALGFVGACTEANLGLTDVARCGFEIRAQCALPLVMDGTCGWGDPVHVRNTVRTALAAGFAAIEIEDQVLPKRVHHHVGREHLVDRDLAVAKIREAVLAAREEGMLVIARTNAARVTGFDEAMRRADAFLEAGADLLLVMPGAAADVERIAQRLPPRLAYMVPTGGLGAIGASIAELGRMGYRLVLDPGTPFFAMARALRLAYEALRAGAIDPTVGAEGADEERHVFAAIGLHEMLEIERRTVER